MTSEQQLHTLLTAKQFGGHFEQQLAVAGIAADPFNRRRLLKAFPQLETCYGPASRFYSEDLG